MDKEEARSKTDECEKASSLINELLFMNNISPSGAISSTLTMLTHYLGLIGMPQTETDKIRKIVFDYVFADGGKAFTVLTEDL